MSSVAEIDWARRVLEVYNAALAEGVGVASLDGLMIDAPVAHRARAILARSGDQQ
jgi:citrate lyase subunit beta/citryl-CoA lyase